VAPPNHSDDEVPAPPRLKRFVHPEAELLDRAIAQVDPAIQHDILDLLAQRLLDSSLNVLTHTRDARAITSLRDAHRELGASPSIKQYRRLRLDRPDLDLIPDGHIRRWLGNVGWNKCLERAHLDAVSDGDFATRGLGGVFSDDELETAARECFEDLGGVVPSWTQYYMWAARPDVQARLGRRPKSPNPFQRRGGLPAILHQLGLASPAPVTVRADGVVRPAKYSYAREDFRAALCEVATALGGTAPRQIDYRRERNRIQQASGSGHAPRLLPCPTVIIKRYGTWAAALADAGLDGGAAKEPPVFSQSGNTQYSDDDYTSILKQAFDDLGEPFTSGRYTRWREQQRRKQRVAGIRTSRYFLPTVSAFTRRFGGWQRACRVALGATYDVRRRRRFAPRTNSPQGSRRDKTHDRKERK